MKKEILKSAGLLIIFICVSATVFCQSNDELKSKIEKLNKEMGDAMIQGNTEKSLSFYTKDAISLPDHNKMLQGIDAIKKSNEDMMKSGSKVTSFETNTLQVMSAGKTITEIGTYKMSFTMPGKTDPMDDKGKYITVWEKQPDGSLKVKVEMWNTDNNPMGMMDKDKMQ